MQCARESDNSNDRYAVAVRKNNAVVGHVPRKISRVCALFLERNGAITCTITGPRRRSADLPQGGMELPCVLAFSGDHSDLLKVKRIMTTLSIQPPPKQASNDEPEQECSDSDTTSDQPLSQEHEDPAEAVELDATEQHAKFWMKIEDIHLTEADKLILTEVGQLNDRHVNAAQRLLRPQHPNLKGLSLTMVASRQKLLPNELQAFFVHGNQIEKKNGGSRYWLCTSAPRIDFSVLFYTSFRAAMLSALLPSTAGSVDKLLPAAAASLFWFYHRFAPARMGKKKSLTVLHH